jgi:peroxiredoxin
MAVDIGAPAPLFSLQNQHGELVSLADFRGRKQVIIVFFPFAFSGVCTGELMQLRDDFADLSGDTTELLAISCDPMYSLRAYADRDGYDFSLLSDFWPHGEVARAYNAFNPERGCPRRLTVIVDRDGIVIWQVESSMGAARDPEGYRRAVSTLR